MISLRIDLENLAAMAALAATTAPGERSRETEEGFFTSATFDDVLKFARRGWPEGAAHAKRLLSQFTLPPLIETHSATFHDVTGAYVDVGQYVQGTPECMVNFTPDTRPIRFVKIIVSAVYSGSFTTDKAINRGVTIAAVIDALESRGIRCDVELVTALSGHDNGKLFIHLPLKVSENPLNLDTLTFAIAHPAYLRRLIFAIMEIQSPAVRSNFSVGGTYGNVIPLPPAPDATTLVFQTPKYGDDWSEEGAIAKANAVLAQYITPKEES
jgi:hypothetical protein